MSLMFPDAGHLTRPLRPPFRFKVAFAPSNGATVELAKVSVHYLKQPSIDVTPRFLSAISTAGIDYPALELPQGRHTFLVSVTDSNGDRRVTAYTFVVGR